MTALVSFYVAMDSPSWAGLSFHLHYLHYLFSHRKRILPHFVEPILFCSPWYMGRNQTGVFYEWAHDWTEDSFLCFFGTILQIATEEGALERLLMTSTWVLQLRALWMLMR